MAYVKWVANADRHNDWTTELVLEDGTVLRQGEPVQINADLKKSLEAGGRVFEDSSKDEADDFNKAQAQPAADAGQSPLLVDEEPFNQANANIAFDQQAEGKNK